MPTVLIIEPMDQIRNRLHTQVVNWGYSVVSLKEFTKILQVIKAHHVDSILLGSNSQDPQTDHKAFLLSQLNIPILDIAELTPQEIQNKLAFLFSAEKTEAAEHSKSEERERLFKLIFVMTMVVLTTLGIAIWSLYDTALNEEKERLVEMVQTKARFIEAVGRFDAEHSRDAHPKGAIAATLSQIVDANQRIKYHNPTVEFVLAKRDGDAIHFILQNGNRVSQDPSLFIENDAYSDQQLALNIITNNIPMTGSHLAEPARRALNGISGTDFLVDYEGETVLAAYEPIMISEQLFSLVFKVDLNEIRKPFLQAAGLTLFISIFVIAIGAKQIFRVLNPVIMRLRREINEREYAEKNIQELNNRLEERVKTRTQELRELNYLNESILQAAGEGICGLNLNGRIAFANPAACDIVNYTFWIIES